MPFRSRHRSGVTPKCWAANGSPSRPKPVITFVEDHDDPFLSSPRARPADVSSAARTAVEPGTVSTMTAAMVSGAISATSRGDRRDCGHLRCPFEKALRANRGVGDIDSRPEDASA